MTDVTFAGDEDIEPGGAKGMIRRDYINGVFVQQLAQFSQMFTEKVLPPFADPEAQANKVTNDYWERKMSEPCDPDGPDEDPGSIADDATQMGIDHYQTVHAMHYTVVNLFTAGLFHLFEQQAGTFVQDWKGKRPKYPVEDLKKLLCKTWRGNETQVKDAPQWPLLSELNLVANVVKHAEGTSADDLRKLNSTHFELPAVRGTSLEGDASRRMLGDPLTGEGIYVTKENFDRFSSATIEFWKWLGDSLGD